MTSSRSQIDAWLAASALISDAPATLDDDGYWTYSGSSVNLTLAVTEESFFVCVPLLTLGSDESAVPSEFFSELLKMQLRCELPEGLMFGLNEEDGRVVLFGRFGIRFFDGTAFEKLIRNSVDAGNRLRSRLFELVDGRAESPTMSIRETVNHIQSEVHLTDRELVMRQMMNFVAA